MKRNWDIDELIDQFTFLPNELTTIGNKTGSTRLGFAVIFKYFQYEARFPQGKSEIPKTIVEYIAKQVQVAAGMFDNYDMTSRTFLNHKAQVRDYFGFGEPVAEDTNTVAEWLCNNILYGNLDLDYLKAEAYKRFRELHIEPPTSERMERLAKSAVFTYENQFFQDTFQKLTSDSIAKMDLLLNDLTSYEETDIDASMSTDSLTFSELMADPGRISLESVFKEISKLRTIHQLGLPDDLFNNIPPKILKKYKLRAVSEKLRELRRHPESMRYTILAAFFWLRSREITDNLIELLIQIIHRIGVRAERKVNKELLNDFRRVNGKTNLLFQMAEAALNHPDEVVKKVLFPVVNENTLRALVKEFKNTGSAYRQQVYTVMRASYSQRRHRDGGTVLPRHSHRPLVLPVSLT
jgi:hypothetical protein